MYNLMYLAAMAACTSSATGATAQSARDIRGPSPLVAIENEAPAELIVDPALPDPLAMGRAYIQYRTENLRVLPVFGKGAKCHRVSDISTSPLTKRHGTLSTPVANR